MGRVVRRVHKDWVHPMENGRLKPLHPADWYLSYAKDFLNIKTLEELQNQIENHGRCPDRNDYMPDWEESELTHLMMYEDTSEGTPISPAFDKPESLARWLFENKASAFGGRHAEYEWWLDLIVGDKGYSVREGSVIFL